jgi:Terpene cyclase DEP1
MNTKSKALCAVYGLIALAALIGTWSQNLAFFALANNGGMLGFIRASGANPAAASIGIDLGMICLASFVWMVVEARRLKVRFVWIYIALSCLIAVSVMFPLFLIARERRIAAAASGALKA